MSLKNKTGKKRGILFVESPGKCPTIRKYLSYDKDVEYDVVATVGHIQQLPSKSGSVFIENNDVKFLWESKGENVDKLIKIVKEKDYDYYYIATDPDREGEGIAYHLKDLLIKNNCKEEKIFRVVFNEITKSAIESSLKKLGQINNNLVEAYLSRLAIDYWIGYELSPYAWRLKGNQSVGRVQSSGLKVIVEKEEKIFNFIEEIYFLIQGIFENLDFLPKLIKYEEEDINRITDSEKAENIEKNLLKIENKEYTIYKITEKDVEEKPSPPFATGTLQQEAATKLGFSVNVTMSNAQKLYEEGLITYMRTDSTIISDEAISSIRKYIHNQFGNDYLNPEIIQYTTKIKNAQEAHEAIRPTDITNNGSSIENEYHRKLYQLIWKRTVACQMTNAIYKKKDILLKNNIAEMSLSGSQLTFLGYLKVYGREEGEDNLLPDLNLNEKISLKDVKKDEHKTKHPPRYTEGGLVKILQKKGIGRPSTYGVIIEVLKKREYVRISNKAMFGLMKGKILIGFLETFLPKYIDYNFTALMEETLDKISNGEVNWKEFLIKFYQNLKDDVKEISTIQLFPMLNKISPKVQKWVKNNKCEQCDSSYNLYISASLYLYCEKCKGAMSIKDDFTFPKEETTEEGEEKKFFRKKFTNRKKTVKK